MESAESATVAAVAAAWEAVAVQVLDWPALRLDGEQVTEFNDNGNASAIEAVCELPFNEAVTVEVCALETDPAVAVKVAVVAAAPTVTDAGTVSEELLLDSATVPPPVCDRVTVQVLDWPVLRLAGAQVSALTDACATRAIEPVREAPFSEAVTLAVCALETDPAVAVKVAVVAAAPTVTDAGTLSEELLLDSATVPPPVCDRVTVQVLDWPALRLDGEQVSEFNDNGNASAIEAVREVPLREAVTVEVCALETDPAVAVKVAVVAAAPTVTDAGTLSEEQLLDSATVPPPVCDRVTVQVLDWPVLRLEGVQVSALTDTGTESAMEAACDVPFSDAVTVAVCALEMDPAEAVKVAVVAAVPTVTDAGTLSEELLLDSATVPPPVCDRVTVQVLDWPALRLVGAH